jgi:hypothetical protein
MISTAGVSIPLRLYKKGLFPKGLKLLGYGAKYSSIFCGEMKNFGNYTSTLPHASVS